MPTPWHTDKWFTSPWNFAPQVREGLQFAPQIKFHDITLRDGEQQTGVALRCEEKVRIAELLAEAGVQRIEAGMPIVSPDDKAAIEKIVSLNLPAQIFCFARCMVDDVDRAADTGAQGVIVEIPSSEHLLEHAYGWSLAKAMDLSISATAHARDRGLYTVFFPIDASRSDLGWFLDLITRVASDGHMDALAVVDTFGGVNPHAISYLVKACKERVKKPVETHFHDDFGLAAANTLIGLAAGAEVAHVTVTSLGERAGNAALEDVAISLLTLYDVDTGLRYEKLHGLSKYVREVTGLTIPSNRPIVGDAIFAAESGIVAAWMRACRPNHLLELFPFLPELVGQDPPQIVLGKGSGMDSIREWLEKTGLTVAEERMPELLLRVKQKSIAKKGLLTEAEFRTLVQEVAAG
jgi:isopropylmalate/homocitrate/citramalate synthase